MMGNEMNNEEEEGPGDVSDFEVPQVPSSILGPLIDLILKPGSAFNVEERAQEDIEDLIDSMGLEPLRQLADMFSMSPEYVVDSMLRSDALRETLIDQFKFYAGIFESIDFEDDGNL